MTMETNGQGVTEPVVKRIAKHELLDAQGNLVESEEQATGIRYTNLNTGQVFEWQTGNTRGDAVTMLALFGAKTLATNEASQVRQKDPDGDQIQAIKDRFEIIGAGQWVDRTREGGVGTRVDLDALAEAICQAYSDAGVVKDKAKVRAALENKDVVAKFRQQPAVSVAYAKIMGRTSKSLDELAAMIDAA